MSIIETDRLILSEFSLDDAPFILEMLNDPGWLEFIGDRGVRTLDDAHGYIKRRLLDSYEKLGYGLYLAKLKNEGIPIGTCGLLKRDYLDDLDIGYAFLPEFRGKGYAFESASAIIEYGKEKLGLKRILAFTNANNSRSIKLLKRLGLGFEKVFEMPDDEGEVELYGRDL